MKVLLDTNVIVSAVTTRGLCADLFRTVLAEHELVICPKIMQEVRRVLHAKFSVPEELIAEYLELIGEDAIVAEKGASIPIPIKDADDIAIISAALAAQADAMVTGDGELLGLNRMRKLRILSPRAFWEELTTHKGGPRDGR